MVLGHRVANTDAGTGAMSGIDQLGAAMLVVAGVALHQVPTRGRLHDEVDA